MTGNSSIARRLATQHKLSETATRHRGNRGAPALRQAAGEPHTRSNLERCFLRFVAAHGLPQPLANPKIGPYTVDFFYPDHQLVIETDEDAHRSAWAFEADRGRDRHLAAHHYRVMRITTTALTHPARLAHEIRQALASPSP